VHRRAKSDPEASRASESRQIDELGGIVLAGGGEDHGIRQAFTSSHNDVWAVQLAEGAMRSGLKAHLERTG
jgi:hypothetical protein